MKIRNFRSIQKFKLAKTERIELSNNEGICKNPGEEKAGKEIKCDYSPVEQV